MAAGARRTAAVMTVHNDHRGSDDDATTVVKDGGDGECGGDAYSTRLCSPLMHQSSPAGRR